MLQSPDETAVAGRTPSKTLVIVGLALGIGLWLLCDSSRTRSGAQLTAYAIAVALCFVAPVRRGLGWLLDQLDRRGAVRTLTAFLLVTVASFAFLFWSAMAPDRLRMPMIHDEFSYLLQARMFAEGHLAMPAHPLGAFFETFYVITDRAYASQYFPGTALMLAPGIWIGFDSWVMPLILSSLAVGMMFLVIRELFDSAAGLASVGMLWAVMGFRVFSISPLSQPPTLLLGLCAIYATLRWVHTRRLGWVVALGLAIGWMAITRPLDAVAFSVPLGGMVLYTLIRERAGGVSWLRIAGAGLLPMLPFLALQLAINHRVTGELFRTPFSYYAQRDLPGAALGFRTIDPSVRPASSLPQKQMFFETDVLPALKKHTPAQVASAWVRSRAVALTGIVFGDRLMLLLVPLGLLVLRDRCRWAVLAILPAWCVAYSFYPLFYLHYLVVVLASAPVLVFAGIETIRRAFPQAQAFMRAFTVIVPWAVAVMVFPQVNAARFDQRLKNELEPAVRKLEANTPGRAIFLFRWGGDRFDWESVYNLSTSWPDDARIIRAHDLGDRNIDLYRYYAAIQPDRVVYRLDRATGSVTALGTVGDLASQAN